ncbi:hypothetical protein [Streptomyces sp. LN785]|uniref:hypothetical protein n=1 Tax=Streptomyces sp. LN785 TaxID=3112983 RepID=UPI003714124F
MHVVASLDEPRNCGEGGLEQNCLAAMGTEIAGPIDNMEYPCIVKRGDPTRQALQPSANMVESAVDQAVHGELTTQRRAGWRDMRLPAFSPQGLFGQPGPAGGGTIPAQVMLGVLAQESNFKQASWHSMYGTSGNTLQPDWFGNGASIHYYPNRAKGDCGYGIGQVTTGMGVAGCSGGTSSHADGRSAGKPATDHSAPVIGRGGAPSPTLVPSRAPSASDWPSKTVTVDKAPRTGRIVPIADGYSGAPFLKQFAANGDFEFSRRTEVEVAGGGTAWHTRAASQAGARETLSVAATVSESGDLESLSCMAYGEAATHRCSVVGSGLAPFEALSSRRTGSFTS